MNNNKNYKYAFLTVAVLLIGAVFYAIYNKSSPIEETIISSDDAPIITNNVPETVDTYGTSDDKSKNSDITGKVVSVNTNAEKKTFIKVKSFADQIDYVLLTSMDPDLVDVNLGDIIRFSDNLKKSQNDAYYFINATTDYKIIEKNNNVNIVIDTVAISEIQESMEGHEIVLRGTISDLTTSKKGHSFFKISDGGSHINGVLFNSETNQLEERLSLLNQYAGTSKTVNLEGKVGVYKGELQIIVSKVYN